MGNSVKDWAPLLGRDRFKVSYHGIRKSGYYQDGQSNWGLNMAAGSSTRVVDLEHPLYHMLERARSKSSQLRTIDYGGPFALERVTVTEPTVISRKAVIVPGTYGHYEGYFPPSVSYQLDMMGLASFRFPGIPADLGIDQLGLWTKGSTAIARSLPDVPKFSLFRFLGELREGLPKAPLKTLAKEKKFRNVGGEYLNFQFGIAPTTSDLQHFIEMLMNPALRTAVKHMLHEEHRVRKVIEKGTTSSTRTLSTSETQVVSPTFSGNITGTETRITDFRIWSSCSFMYYQAKMLEQLFAEIDSRLGGFGIIPKASDIWALIPWSWLVDWFTNFNHVITNLSYLGRDGLHLQRGYLMATYHDTLITRQTRLYMGSPLESIGTRSYVRKYRVKASPFGFGLTWKDFDPFQLSILGALGINRMRF